MAYFLLSQPSCADILNLMSTQTQTKADLELLAGILDGLGDIPAVHVVGNHDLAFMTKDDWLAKLKTPAAG